MMKKLGILIILFSLVFLTGCIDPNTNNDTTSTTSLITTEADVTTTNQTTTNQSTTTETLTTSTVLMTTIEGEQINISLNPGVDTLEVFDVFVDAGATATYGDYNLGTTVIETTVDSDNVGIYYITYQAVFGSITAEITRVVFIVDTTKPVLILNPGIDTIYQGNEWIDAGVIATDNYDTDLSVIVTGAVDINVVGTYEIIYTVIDSFGNETSLTRFVSVIEN